MKQFNRQILEAINRGILFALDDFDNEVNDSPKISKIKYDSKKNLKLLIHLYILQLLSLTLTKKDLDTLILSCKLAKYKYKVPNKNILKSLIRTICTIDNYADLNWIDVSKITDMSEMFKKTTFNGNITNWDVSNVINMQEMFKETEEFTGENTDLSNWHVSNVKNMNSMFCISSFIGIHNDLTNWDVSNVELMESMFSYSIFNGNISKWDVSNVKKTKYMFMYSAFNLDISDWKLDSISDSYWMFYKAQFNLDLSRWTGEKLGVSTFKFSNIDFEHLPKYWQEEPIKNWK